MICDACQQVVDEAGSSDRPSNANGLHHLSERTFELARLQHCFICQYLWEAANGAGNPQIWRNSTLFEREESREYPSEGSYIRQSYKPVTRYGWGVQRSAYQDDVLDEINFVVPIKTSDTLAVVHFELLSKKGYLEDKKRYPGFSGTY